MNIEIISLSFFKTQFSVHGMCCRPIPYVVDNIDKYMSIKYMSIKLYTFTYTSIALRL
jgi:hypothetical protein